jgi:excisionase family DNA binding protein
MDQLVSPAKAAEFVGVSKWTLQRWEQQGLIRSIRTLGGHRRYWVSDLMRIVAVKGDG